LGASLESYSFIVSAWAPPRRRTPAKLSWDFDKIQGFSSAAR
jgi:hypothetical protein